VKNKNEGRKSEVERMLARVHPHLERVNEPRRKKSRAVAHGITAEASEMRVHARIGSARTATRIAAWDHVSNPPAPASP